METVKLYYVVTAGLELIVRSTADKNSIMPGESFGIINGYRYVKMIQNTPNGLSKTEMCIPLGPFTATSKDLGAKGYIQADIIIAFEDMSLTDQQYIEEMLKSADVMAEQDQNQRKARNAGITLIGGSPQ